MTVSHNNINIPYFAVDENDKNLLIRFKIL